MDDVALTNAPERDRAEIERYIESYGGAIVLRVGDKIGSDAHQAFVDYKKSHDYADPPYDFVWIGDSTLGRDSSAAVVDEAESETRSGHHETVGERQGRQPAPGFFRRLFRRSQSVKPEPSRGSEWLDDDDPLARVLNAAWRDGSSYWTEGDPLPEKVENPKKIARSRVTVRSLIEEARYTAEVLAPQFGDPAPIVVVLRALADNIERIEVVLHEIAADVKLADDLSVATQLAALWRVVQRHSEIAQEALSGD